jgi:hypothetical protein
MTRFIWGAAACVNTAGLVVGCFRHDMLSIVIGVLGAFSCLIVASS